MFKFLRKYMHHSGDMISEDRKNNFFRDFFPGLQFRAIQPQKFNSIKENEEDDSIGYQKLFANYKILVVSGAIWVSTSAMALLEPCLPIWLMDNVHPEVITYYFIQFFLSLLLLLFIINDFSKKIYRNGSLALFSFRIVLDI